MKKAVVDVGTNAVKFLVAGKGSDGSLRIAVDAMEVARLGERLSDTGRIVPEALERNVRAVAAFVGEARSLGVASPVIVGTMALRAASNAADFVARVKALTGIDLRVLDGVEEARLSWSAAISAAPACSGEVAVFDTGGGSTELICGGNPDALHRLSLPIGAVHIMERFFTDDPVRTGAVDDALAEIRTGLKEGGAGCLRRADAAIGVGGAVTTLASVKGRMKVYDPDVVHGSILTLQDVRGMIERFSSMTLEERCAVVGLHPKRADVILAGACVILALLEQLGVSFCAVSDRGLRHALIEELFSADVAGKKQ